MDLRSFNVYKVLFAKRSALLSVWINYQEASFYDMEEGLHNTKIQDIMAIKISEML